MCHHIQSVDVQTAQSDRLIDAQRQQLGLKNAPCRLIDRGASRQGDIRAIYLVKCDHTPSDASLITHVAHAERCADGHIVQGARQAARPHQIDGDVAISFQADVPRRRDGALNQQVGFQNRRSVGFRRIYRHRDVIEPDFTISGHLCVQRFGVDLERTRGACHIAADMAGRAQHSVLTA